MNTFKLFQRIRLFKGAKTVVVKGLTGLEAGWVENKRRRKQYNGQAVTKFNIVANRCWVKEARPAKTFSVLSQNISLFLSSYSQCFLTPQFGSPTLPCSSVLSRKITLFLSCLSQHLSWPQDCWLQLARRWEVVSLSEFALRGVAMSFNYALHCTETMLSWNEIN